MKFYIYSLRSVLILDLIKKGTCGELVPARGSPHLSRLRCTCHAYQTMYYGLCFLLFIYLFIYLLCIYLFTYLLFIYLLNYLFIYLLIYYLFIIYLFIHSSKCPNIFFIYLFANNLDLPFFFTYNYANRYSSIELDTFLAIEIKDRSHHLITYRSCFLASELCTLLVQTQVYFVTTEWHKTKVYVSHPRLDITQTSVNCFKLSVLLFRLLHIFDQASTPRGWW